MMITDNIGHVVAHQAAGSVYAAKEEQLKKRKLEKDFEVMLKEAEEDFERKNYDVPKSEIVLQTSKQIKKPHINTYFVNSHFSTKKYNYEQPSVELQEHVVDLYY